MRTVHSWIMCDFRVVFFKRKNNNSIQKLKNPVWFTFVSIFWCLGLCVHNRSEITWSKVWAAAWLLVFSTWSWSKTKCLERTFSFWNLNYLIYFDLNHTICRCFRTIVKCVLSWCLWVWYMYLLYIYKL